MIKEAQVYYVTCAYNSFEGLPCCGYKKLRYLLSDEVSFKGQVVSDCWAVKDFYDKGDHEVVATKETAEAMTVKVRPDLNC